MHSGDESQTKLFPEASDFVESLRASFQEKLQSDGVVDGAGPYPAEISGFW